MGRIGSRLFLGCVALVLGLAACSPNSQTSVSTPSGFQIFLIADPNAIPAVPLGGDLDLGGCSLITAKVFDQNGRLVDGALVFFAGTVGVFRVGTEDFFGRAETTVNGLATVFFCSKDVRGTAVITATVETASARVLVTIF